MMLIGHDLSPQSSFPTILVRMTGMVLRAQEMNTSLDKECRPPQPPKVKYDADMNGVH